jgi:hypothetical protein
MEFWAPPAASMSTNAVPIIDARNGRKISRKQYSINVAIDI